MRIIELLQGRANWRILVLSFASFVALASAACAETLRQGDFDYQCEQGWGIADGWTCEAALTGKLILFVGEDGVGPTIHYRIDDSSSARLVPPKGDALIVAVGFDDRVVVAEASDGAWYFVVAGELEAGLNWPKVHGPFNRVEFDAEFDGTESPPMRRTK